MISGFYTFQYFTDEEYEELDLVHNISEAGNGEHIYFPNKNHYKLNFTKERFIELSYVDDQGNEIIKEIILKGEIFGQFSLEKNNEGDEIAQAYKRNVSLCSFKINDFFAIVTT